MSYNLFLDDVRFPNTTKHVELPMYNWVIVRSYDEFVKIITERNLPYHINFDHDLSYDDQNKTSNFTEKTGYDCAKFLVEYCMKTNQDLPEFGCHSMNYIGKQNIISLLENYKNKQQNIDE